MNRCGVNRSLHRESAPATGMGVPVATWEGKIKTLLVVGLVLLCAVPGIAQTEESDSTDSQSAVIDETQLVLGEPSPETGGAATSAFGFWDFARMLLVLGIVVGIIYIVFYFLKRAGKGTFAESEQISVVGTQNLPGNRAIYLVKVGSQIFMVGAGGDAVTMLGEITDKETVDAMILAAASRPESTRRSFGELVAGVVRGNQDGTLNLMRQQRERLQRLQ